MHQLEFCMQKACKIKIYFSPSNRAGHPILQGFHTEQGALQILGCVNKEPQGSISSQPSAKSIQVAGNSLPLEKTSPKLISRYMRPPVSTLSSPRSRSRVGVRHRTDPLRTGQGPTIATSSTVFSK